ncbi:hypothetical protein V1478_006714 [Vespula squamosa]|uniref:Uncharacterized protein n=1 Tax=Vespula squamosa TaxID=30214 RepID=A0ABD2B0N9_VESSQ
MLPVVAMVVVVVVAVSGEE